MKATRGLIVNLVTIVAAAAIGFGVPLGWVWIGSQLQGESGATTLSFSVAVLILAGIIATYVAVLFFAGWVMARLGVGAEATGPARSPWMQGMTEGAGKNTSVSGVERLFVMTTLLVSAAFWVWFLFFAQGGGLPAA